MKLSTAFYQREDTLKIARELLGKELFTCIDNKICSGIIVETEAYLGPEDQGSHAYNNRRTSRNEMMYADGGLVYMYICYGIHPMFNVVTGKKGSSHAILIRAIQPQKGTETMCLRRELLNNDHRLCQGPGSLAKALGLNITHNGVSLQENIIWIEDKPLRQDQVESSPRIGLNINEPYLSMPWRFYLQNNPYVSGKKLALI